MSKQCLDISQMKHLQELGLDTSKASCFYDVHKPTNSCELFWGYDEDSNDVMFESIPAFTLQDILDLLPNEIDIEEPMFGPFYLYIDYEHDDLSYCFDEPYGGIFVYKSFSFRDGNRLIDAAYEALCWCIENRYVKTNKNG